MTNDRLAARLSQIRRVRQRVVAATLATFVLAWGVIAYDGSMGATAVATTTTSGVTAAQTGSSASSSSSGTLTTRQS